MVSQGPVKYCRACLYWLQLILKFGNRSRRYLAKASAASFKCPGPSTRKVSGVTNSSPEADT